MAVAWYRMICLVLLNFGSFLPKINRVLPSIVDAVQSLKYIWPFDPKINRDPPQVMVNTCVKYDHCMSKGNLVIVETIFPQTDNHAETSTPPQLRWLAQYNNSATRGYLYVRIYPTIRFQFPYYKLPVPFIFKYNQVTSDPSNRSSIQSSCSCADSPFLYPPEGHVVTGDLTCIPDKGLRSLFKKEPKYILPSRIDFTKCRSIVGEALQT